MEAEVVVSASRDGRSQAAANLAMVRTNPPVEQRSILRVEGLSKRYGNAAVLRDISFDLIEGEFVTLLGPSGSGKTTLLKIIAGAIPTTAGTVQLNGRDITHLPARFRGIGMVFQNFALMPHMSVFDNVAFPLSIRRVARSEIRDRVAEVLRIVRLPDIGNRKPKELSGGQQQRVAIARALVYRPPLILMDEPLGALDKSLRQEMQFEIKKIHEDLGLSVIYVTHDQEEALTLSDRVCLMGDGEIQEFGKPEQMYMHPESVFTADFFGATNIFEGLVSAVGEFPSIDDSAFRAIKAGDCRFKKGANVGWMVRPERIRILDSNDGEDNTFEGEVTDTVLSGQITHIIVQVAPGRQMHIASLTGNSQQPLQKGMAVRFGWNRNATKILRPTRRLGG